MTKQEKSILKNMIAEEWKKLQDRKATAEMVKDGNFPYKEKQHWEQLVDIQCARWAILDSLRYELQIEWS